MESPTLEAASSSTRAEAVAGRAVARPGRRGSRDRRHCVKGGAALNKAGRSEDREAEAPALAAATTRARRPCERPARALAEHKLQTTSYRAKPSPRRSACAAWRRGWPCLMAVISPQFCNSLLSATALKYILDQILRRAPRPLASRCGLSSQCAPLCAATRSRRHVRASLSSVILQARAKHTQISVQPTEHK